jgi:Fic family protein
VNHARWRRKESGLFRLVYRDNLLLMPDDQVIRELNVLLTATPYSLPADEQGVHGVGFLLHESEAIVMRHQDVETEFRAKRLDIQQRVEAIVRVREVFESNALESAGLDLAGTEEAMSRVGSSVDDLGAYIAQQIVQRDQHLLEVLGLEQALIFAHQLADDFYRNARPLLEIDIRQLHKFTLPGESHAGSYKQREVAIAGSTVTPSTIVDVQDHVKQLVDWLNSTDVAPPLAAAVIHSWLTIIHPFEDGNGRLARLLANIVLLKAGWPPLIIRASDRLQYLDALSHSDDAGDILPIFDLFVKSIRRGLRELEKPDLAEKLFEADLRRQPALRYELWCDHLTAFVNELRGPLRAHGIEVHRMSTLPVSTFLLLEDRESAGNTWFAKLQGKGGVDLLMWLGKSSNQMFDGTARGTNAPSLFISERDPGPGSRHAYMPPWQFTRLRLNEIAIHAVPGQTPVDIRYGLTVVERSIAGAGEVVSTEIIRAAQSIRSEATQAET